MRHALAVAPAKSKHQILLEYSKAAFLSKRPSVAYSLLLFAIRSYPEEWKLELEYLQQKVREPSLLTRRLRKITFGRRWT